MEEIGPKKKNRKKNGQGGYLKYGLKANITKNAAQVIP